MRRMLWLKRTENERSLSLRCKKSRLSDRAFPTASVRTSGSLVLETVDLPTGNIDSPGSVHIQGNVSNGFTVKTERDIAVKGVVENAALIAGGSIVLCRGGMDRVPFAQRAVKY